MPIRVNMIKARAIHMEVIRDARNSELAALDITFMRAIEAGDTEAQTEIAQVKQLLRDIPQTFLLDDYLDPDSLMAAWPEGL